MSGSRRSRRRRPVLGVSSAFVVGAGRVGTGLSVRLAELGVEVLGTWNRSPEAARRTRRITGAPASSARFPAAIREAGLVALTVPDDAVEPVCRALAAEGRLGAGQLVVHCSGSLGLAPLDAAASAGARVGSLHPLMAFSDPRTAAEAFDGALAVVEGDDAVASILERLARALGMRPARLPPGDGRRALYHAAAVTAAGHLVALMDLSLEIAAASGLSPEEAVRGLVALATGSLANLERTGLPEAALTGPVARGDVAVIARHLDALGSLPPESRALYRALLERSIAVAEKGGRDVRALCDLLARASRPAAPHS